MGAATLEAFLDAGAAQITILNRGSAYWDARSRVFENPRVSHISCDRSQIASCFSGSQERSWDLAFDFSASSDGGWVGKAAATLKLSVRLLYVYISSDSAYEVCGEGFPEDRLHGHVESDAVRPADPSQRELFASRDDYGHEKLRGEELLREELQNSAEPKLPFVVLRLPDVIGDLHSFLCHGDML